MKQLPYVCLHRHYLETLSMLSDAERGRLIWGLLQFNEDGTEPELKGKAAVLWPTLRSQHIHDRESYENRCLTNSINGAKGGRPRKKPAEPPKTERFSEETEKTEGFSEKPKKPNKNNNSNESTNGNGNNNSNNSDNTNTYMGGYVYVRNDPPTISEIEEYCFAKGYNLDAEMFYNHYAGNGWQVGSQPMRDWRPILDNWMKRNIPHEKPAEDYSFARFMEQFSENPDLLAGLSPDEKIERMHQICRTPLPNDAQIRDRWTFGEGMPSS